MDEHMSLGQWVVTLLLICIPCVNIIMLLVWAFGNNGYVERKRFAQAELIFVAIGFVLGIICYAVMGAAMLTAFSSYGLLMF